MNDYEDERPYLQDVARHRRYRYELMLYPDCRDPDHPGCEHCMDNDEEE